MFPKYLNVPTGIYFKENSTNTFIKLKNILITKYKTRKINLVTSENLPQIWQGYTGKMDQYHQSDG